MSDATTRCCTVLICDDQQALLDAVTLAVGALDQFQVVGAVKDGPMCLDYVSASHPDLLILDVNLPGGGPRLARAVKDASPDTYILVYSGRRDQDTQQAMLAAGADSYLVKSGRLAPLIGALRGAPQNGCCQPR